MLARLPPRRGLGSSCCCGGGGCCCCGCGSRGARGMGATLARRPLRVMTSSPDGPVCVKLPAAATAAAGAATAGGVTPAAGAPANPVAALAAPACVSAAALPGSGSSSAGARRLLSVLAPERCASGPLAARHGHVTRQRDLSVTELRSLRQQLCESEIACVLQVFNLVEYHCKNTARTWDKLQSWFSRFTGGFGRRRHGAGGGGQRADGAGLCCGVGARYAAGRPRLARALPLGAAAWLAAARLAAWRRRDLVCCQINWRCSSSMCWSGVGLVQYMTRCGLRAVLV
jgi:hypothetical protein